MRRVFTLAVAALAGTFALACEPEPLPPPNTPPPPPPETAAPAPPEQKAPPSLPAKLDAIPRAEFNRLAAELYLPLFWIADANGNGALDPEELAVLFGFGDPGAAWIKDGAFGPAFAEAYAAMLASRGGAPLPAGASEAEKKRREAIRAELSQGLPSLVRSDFRNASAEDRALVQHVLAAAARVEHIYARQRGVAGMEAEIPADDTASHMVFHRNQGPWCQSAKMEKDPDCNALARRPGHVSGMYPASLQADPKFCEKLDKHPDQKKLLSPFVVVGEKGGALEAIPYSVAYKDDMEVVSRELAAAAEAVSSPGEAPLKAYLTAASRAFLDNNWEPADEAWAKMSVLNSKWYLRVGPDETYADPCNRKAGFHVSFARINQDSLTWQKRLQPVQGEMESTLAKLAGGPYKARKVTFHLPDFIDIVLNAGDSRNAFGATIGQSLPNWGPVANEGRGRTVAMTNLYTDADNRAILHARAASLLCKGTFDPAGLDPALGVMGTVLHEAAHNLGPAHEYRVKGKTDSEVFGGPLASMLEELKAQTSALYFTDWLAQKGLIDKNTARLGHEGNLVWTFGHISDGMYAADGTSKPYSQLASIQVGSLLKAGAMAWRAEEAAANGRDKGCFEIKYDKLPAAIVALEKNVLGIKSRGDKEAALKLRGELVDATNEWSRLRGVIAERWLRAPRASFVYSIAR